jgi:hypothetical protein
MMIDFAFRPFLPPTNGARLTHTLRNFGTALGDELTARSFSRRFASVTTAIAFVLCYRFVHPGAGRPLILVGIAMIAPLVPF